MEKLPAGDNIIDGKKVYVKREPKSLGNLKTESRVLAKLATAKSFVVPSVVNYLEACSVFVRVSLLFSQCCLLALLL